VERIQKNQITSTMSSTQVKAGMRVSRCIYTALHFGRTVIIEIAQPADANITTSQVWQKLTASAHSPKAVAGLGEAALWSADDGGQLLVRDGEYNIRISAGAAGSEDEPIENARTMARIILDHLKAKRQS
jgi:hypothetical protein